MRIPMLLSIVVLGAALVALQGMALAGTAEGQMIAVQSLGEANAVAAVLPQGNETLIQLRDGTQLVVPAAMHLPYMLEEGAWINATVKQIDGRNIVQSLDVVHDAGERGSR